MVDNEIIGSLHQALVSTRLRTNVLINGVATPLVRAIDSLARFCRPVLLHKNPSSFEVAFSGSSLLFRSDGRNYMLFSKHQLRGQPGDADFDPKTVVLVIYRSDGVYGVSPIAMRRPSSSNERDLTWDDVVLIEFEHRKDDTDLDPLFLQYDWHLRPTAPQVGLDRLKICFTIGFPHVFTDYDMTFDDDWRATSLNLKSRWCVIFLRPRPRRAWDLDTRIAFEQDPDRSVVMPDPNGLSGSPVFSIYENNSGELEIGVMGMLTHCDGESFQVYDGGNLANFITTLPRYSALASRPTRPM